MDVIGTTLPHSEFGDPDCCGCLNAVIVDETAEIVCNECTVILLRLPASQVRRVLTEMELEIGFATAICPHCGAANLFPGFTEMIAFTCRECGGSSSAA
jgi:hypothetical protein